MNQTKLLSRQKGFSMVEFILVLGFFTLIIGLIISFFISTLSGRFKVAAHIEAQEQARFLTARLVYEIKRSNGVQSGASFGVNLANISTASFGLTMSDSSHNPTVFSVQNNIVYIQQGASAKVALTSKDVSVTNLVFTNESTANGRSKNILINFTVFKSDPTGKVALNITYPVETAVEIQGQ